MKKAKIFQMGILGIILLIVGIIFSPSFVGSITSDGSIDSGIRTAQIHMFQYFAIVFGILLILISILIYYSSEAKRASYILLSLCFIGIVLTIMGIIFSPAFVEKNLTSIGYLNEESMNFFTSLQVIIITLGCIIILISLLIYGKKFLAHSLRYGIIFSILTIIFYLTSLYCTYVSTTYPFNIFFKPSQYGKVVDLLLGRDILLGDFDPQPTLKSQNVVVTKAKFPVIDIHFHFYSSFKTDYDKKVLTPENLLSAMDSLNIKTIVNLDNNLGDMEGVLNKYARAYPGKFINFYPRWFPADVVTDEFMAQSGARIKEMVEMGARGLKIWKNLGVKTRDTRGKLIPVDDPRLDNMWEMAGKLKIPVLWHMLDPAALFQPINRFNERYPELGGYPQWSYYGDEFPTREKVFKQRENVFKKHPNTIFIGAHMGENADDLAYAAYLLDTYPNYYLEFSSVIVDLGRQPYTTREFFIKYQDRILFGSDGGSLFGVHGWTLERFYQTYFQFLETENEYFDYQMQGAFYQGGWKIYGLHLPDDVLEKIYNKNAEKILSMFSADSLKNVK